MSAHMHVLHAHIVQRPEEGSHRLGLQVTDDCELPSLVVGFDFGSSIRANSALTTDIPLHPRREDATSRG